MATLEAIAKELTTEKGEPKQYSPKTLVGTIELTQELASANPQTAKGLAEYRKLTGMPTKGKLPEETMRDYKTISGNLQSHLETYINKHFGQMISNIPETYASQLVPQFLSDSITAADDYNKTRDAITEQKNIIKQIQENPKEYLKKEIEKAPKYLKLFLAKTKDTLKIDMAMAERKATLALNTYGANKFLKETYQAQKSIEEKLEKEIRELEKERTTLEEKMPGTLTSTEEITNYFKGTDEKLSAKYKKLSEIAFLEELKKQVIGITAQEYKKSIADKEQKAAA